MTCYSPIQGYRTPDGVVFKERHGQNILGNIQLPCGQCVGCRMRRATEWQLRCTHEAKFHEDKAFLTLTYGRDKLPPNGSLCHEDFQKFMKRLRERQRIKGPSRVLYYMCGEYGPKNQRPHYHCNLFGKDFTNRKPIGRSESGELYYEDPELTEIWGHGRASVQTLTRETIGYTTRYIMTKALGQNAEQAYQRIDPETGEIIQLQPEYNAMSKGIGKHWFHLYKGDVYPHDYVVSNGVKHPVPKYYDKLLKRLGSTTDLQAMRELRASKSREHQTPERLAVRETVHLAKIRNLKRENDI